MATSFLVDPLQMWRDAVTKLETEVNSMATGSTKYDDVVRALHQFSSVSLGMEQLLEKVIGGYLRRANLPSRKEVLELAESLRRIEDKVDRLLPAEAGAAVLAPRPPRTRRPASASAPAPAGAARASGEVGAPSEAVPDAARAPAVARASDDATSAAPAKTRTPSKSTKPTQAAAAKRPPMRRKGG